MSKKLKFKIGEQYEKHEFELDWVKSVLDDNLRYGVYSYIGNDKITIFGFEAYKVLLAYNCDFLAGVFYFIELNYSSKMFLEILANFSCTRRINVSVIKTREKITYLFVADKRISNYSIFI